MLRIVRYALAVYIGLLIAGALTPTHEATSVNAAPPIVQPDHHAASQP